MAFPTETVYGLGANALDATAVGRIFVAKGRPANNPLIVHVADAAEAPGSPPGWPRLPRAGRALLARPVDAGAAERAEVPDRVTGGGPTVAVRVPAHPVALALLRAAGCRWPHPAPIARTSCRRRGPRTSCRDSTAGSTSSWTAVRRRAASNRRCSI